MILRNARYNDEETWKIFKGEKLQIFFSKQGKENYKSISEITFFLSLWYQTFI